MDRISGLPQPIQLHILNCLEEKEIGRAAVLSKEWKSIVQFRPVLESVQSNILNYLDEKEIARAAVLSKAWRSIVHTRPVFDERRFKRKRMSHKEDLCFMNHVDHFLQKHDPSIQKFSLVTEIYHTQSFSDYLDRWIQQLVEAKLKVLGLNLKQGTEPHIGYRLSPFVFLSESITNLRLSKCNLGQSNYMRLPNLLELSLEYVTLNQGMIDQISSGCPNLEILHLFWCTGFSSICVSGLAKLHEVELNLGYDSQTDVKLVAPMLRVFKLASSLHSKIELLACESTLRNLSLSCVKITAEGLRDLISKFHRLEKLVLADLEVQSIEIPNQRFLKLEVRRCYRLEKRVRIDAPNLRVLKYYKNNLSFDPVISSISPSCEIDISASDYYTMTIEKNKCNIQSCRDLFLTLSGFSDMKFIFSDLNRELIVCQVLDENVIKKIYNSEATMIGSADVLRITSHEHMADHLFDSRFGRKSTISIVSRDQQSNAKFFEVLRKKTLKEKEEEPNCCRYKSRKCWRHSLNDAEMIDQQTGDWTSRSALFKSIVAMGHQTARIKLHWT